MDGNTEKTAGSNLTPIAEYTETAAALADLRDRHAGVVYDVTVPKEMRAAKEARAELRGLRTGLEKKRVEIKAPALERCRLIDAEAKRITAELVALEEPIDVQIKTEEARAETARLEKLEAERLRVEAIQQKIQSIRDVPGSLVGKPSIIIAGQLAELRKTVLDEAELGADYLTATDALTAAIARVEQLLVAQQEADAEKMRQAERDAEMEAMRVKMAEQQRLIDEAEEARRVEQERLAQVERDRVAAEEAAARAAEQTRLDEIARVEREEREREQKIRSVIAGMISPPMAHWASGQIDEYIAKFMKLDPRAADNDFDFGEFGAEACDAFDAALSGMHDTRREVVAREIEEYEAAERRSAEERQLQAERERQAAEQKKLDEQAAQLKRDQQAAAAKAEGDRLKNLGLREAAQALLDYFPEEPADTALATLLTDLHAALDNEYADIANQIGKRARTKRAARA